VRWSARTRWDLAETPWAQHLTRLRTAGERLWDLTASNPTHCGFSYDPDAVFAPLHDRSALVYEPDPKGLLVARQAISLYYREHRADVDPERIFLTASTSEAYSFLFRLLCDPGDEVLIGQPGYPLFDFLAQLDDVRLVPHQLLYDHGWVLDPEALRRRITPRTRAIMVVHPNNPTGHFTRAEERAILERLCRDHNLALIVDEVFLDYPHRGQAAGQSFAAGEHPVPTFVLSGLSKIAALPQMKASWIACFAEAEALERLVVISDTFLSVSTPIQRALPAWLLGRGPLEAQIQERVQQNLATLDTILQHQSLITRLPVEAGWYVLLRIPGLQSGEEVATELLLGHGVVLHSADFFGFSGQGWLVISLMAPPLDFQTGAEAVLKHFSGRSSEN
jgi:alanine-synthesizing transaminase